MPACRRHAVAVKKTAQASEKLCYDSQRDLVFPQKQQLKM